VKQRATARAIGSGRPYPLIGGRIMPELEKLPQARRYLRAARWGLNTMLEQKVMGPGYIFYVTGLLATLRAVPHILTYHDNKLSPQHQAVIEAW
jgi:hypothetical protein